MQSPARQAAHTWALAIAISFVVGLAWQLGGPSDHQAEQDSAADVADAQRTAAAQERFYAAARRICGENAAWRDLGNGAVQCTTKRGQPTQVAQVRP